LRLYRIDDYLTFLGDEGRDVTIVRRMLTQTHPALIGPQTSVGNMYLGPLYYYLMAIPLLVSNYSPVGPAVMVAMFSLFTIALLWWISRQWFGRIPALMISLFYAISPTTIVLSRSSWNPNIMPFFALLSMYGIWKVWYFGYWRWLIITAVSMAFVLQSHYLGLLLMLPIVFFLLLSPKKPGFAKRTAISVVVFLLLMSPLLFFDMRHNWLNSKAMLKFFTERQTTVNFRPYKAIPNIWPLFTDLNSTLLTARHLLLAQITGIVLLIGAVIGFIKKGQTRNIIFILIWLISGLIGLGLYKQHIYDHYFGFLFPVPFLLLGLLIKNIKYLSLLLLLPLLYVNLINNPLRHSPNMQMERTRTISEFINNESKGKPFNLALIATRNYDAGYRYFLELENAPVVKIENQIAPELYVVCEEPVCQPVNHRIAEIANFGWSKIDQTWEFPWGVKVFRLIHAN
jgi:4-amino-4-deoxy-L-arabinose transferase-like glycosyltransferase